MKTEIEKEVAKEGRLARLEEKLDNHIEAQGKFEEKLDTTLSCMDKKLDHYAETKADKAEVERLGDRFWAIVVTLLFTVLGVLYSLIK